MEKQVNFMLTCVITLLAIILSVSGGKYCCPYYTSSGSYRSSFYCSKYCCGTSTSKYCCTSSYSRYYPSYSSSSLCPTATKGEYCCPYYTSSGSYRSSFYCSKYCCGTSTSKYCCTSSYSRYYPSYSSSSLCPTATKGEYCCAHYTSSGSYKSSFYCPKYCCGT
ncbi:keratin-associated protein 5-4-like, partial [Lingula anatina]|uniref:Keratin-associated protein 5-4-like n=1 Tax=Lingula anatina TaxID=7574 RepID=A0A1S3HAC1_LINAN